MHCHSSATREQVCFQVGTTLPENLRLKADEGIIYCHEARQQPRQKNPTPCICLCIYIHVHVCVSACIYMHICICVHTGSLPAWNFPLWVYKIVILEIFIISIVVVVVVVILNNILIFFWKSISDLKLLAQSIRTHNTHQRNTMQK